MRALIEDLARIRMEIRDAAALRAHVRASLGYEFVH